jgi:pantoate--beta-alanine ligase
MILILTVYKLTEDLSTYPKTLDRDLEVLSEGKTDILFLPSAEEMYPSGFVQDISKQTGTFVTVHGKSHQMEGITRPHFFRGVATVVSKFFNIIQPTHAFFGQKDIQQCAVIRQMVRDMHFPIVITA